MTPPEKSQLCTDARSAGGRNLRGYLLKLDSFVYATSYFPLWAGLFRLFPQLPSCSTRIQELNKQFFKMPSSGNVRQCHRQARWAFEWEEPARPRTQLMKSNRKAGSFIRLFSCSAITSESFCGSVCHLCPVRNLYLPLPSLWPALQPVSFPTPRHQRQAQERPCPQLSADQVLVGISEPVSETPSAAVGCDPGVSPRCYIFKY